MELVRGGDLLDHVLKHGPFDDTQAKRFMRQLLSAVEHLHAKRIVHRDLKVGCMVAVNAVVVADGVGECDGCGGWVDVVTVVPAVNVMGVVGGWVVVG
jgi:Neu-associated kinase